jgi:hypothetical protein
LPPEIAVVQHLEQAALLLGEAEAGLADVVLEEEVSVRRECPIDLRRQVLEIRDVVDRARADDQIVALGGQLHEVQIGGAGLDPPREPRRERGGAALRRTRAQVDQRDVKPGIHLEQAGLAPRRAGAEQQSPAKGAPARDRRDPVRVRIAREARVHVAIDGSVAVLVLGRLQAHGVHLPPELRLRRRQPAILGVVSGDAEESRRGLVGGGHRGCP